MSTFSTSPRPSSSPSSSTAPDLARQPRAASAVAGLLSAAVAAAWTVFGAHDLREVALVLPVIAVVAALVYGVVVPRALARAGAGAGVGGTALALGVPAVLLTLPFYWSGLPLVLGVAGAMVGNAGRRTRPGGGMAVAGMVLGLLAVAGYLTIYIVDGVILGNS